MSHLQIGLMLTTALDIAALYASAFGWLYTTRQPVLVPVISTRGKAGAGVNASR